MKIKVLDDKGEEIQPQETVEADYVEPRPDGMLLIEQIGQLFDFRMSEVNTYKTELKTLIEYAKRKTDDHSIEGLKWALTDLGIRLGTPPMGEKRIKQLTRYAHLYLETKQNEERMQNMLRDNDDN